MPTTTNNPVATERKRKFLLVLPLLVFPFLTFLLWSVGLLSSGKSNAQSVGTAQHGFNMHLPDAKPKDHKSWNKLDYYSQADQDSAKLKEAMQRDLYYKKGLPMLQGDTGIAATNSTATAYHFSYDPSPPSPKNYHDPNVEKVNQQLAKLKAVLNQPPEKQGKSMVTAEVPVQPNTSISSPDIHRLENIVQSMHQKDSSADPEMEQLNGMMDKLLDIQHPERVKERIREQSQKNKQQVFPVVVNSSNDNISLLQSNAVPSVQQDSIPPVKDTLVATVSVLTPNAFYSLDDTNNGSDEKPNAVEAVVQETQTLVSGATVKLRLMSEVYINGVLIPKDNFIYGMASLNGERLNISITTIRYQNNILPVALSVYDMDGLSGIYIPGAITRDVAKQSADESLQGIGLTTLDPSLSAQAASAGIQAAKTLISKKVKLVRVTVKAGYRVLLRDTNQK